MFHELRFGDGQEAIRRDDHSRRELHCEYIPHFLGSTIPYSCSCQMDESSRSDQRGTKHPSACSSRISSMSSSQVLQVSPHQRDGDPRIIH